MHNGKVKGRNCGSQLMLRAFNQDEKSARQKEHSLRVLFKKPKKKKKRTLLAYLMEWKSPARAFQHTYKRKKKETVDERSAAIVL